MSMPLFPSAGQLEFVGMKGRKTDASLAYWTIIMKLMK